MSNNRGDNIQYLFICDIIWAIIQEIISNIWLFVIYDDSGDNVPFQMIWNCFCASNCTNCTKLLRFVSISPEIAPLSKFPDQYKHLRYLSFHQFLLECKRLKKTQYFSNAHIWFFKKEIQHGFLHFAWCSAGWYFQLVNIFLLFFLHVFHVL